LRSGLADWSSRLGDRGLINERDRALVRPALSAMCLDWQRIGSAADALVGAVTKSRLDRYD
jgi:hypothetical protein